MRFSRRFLLVLLLWPLLATVPLDTGLAGPHAGGTLLVHATNQPYSTGQNYCDTPTPESCESVETRVDLSGPTVWVVYGAFLDAESPRLRGIEFGVNYSPGIEIVAHGSCADLERSMFGWPASGTGTIIVWFDNQFGQLIPAYWFAGYAATAGAAATFSVTPHPENGGHFGDDSIIPVTDEIAAYGSIGFGVPGTAPCPERRTFTIRPDGTGDVPTISDALRIAAAGSVIQLEDGIYRGPGNRDLEFHHTPLTLRSISGNPEACVIDCEGSPEESHRGIWIRWLEDTESLVSGIKFINGYAGHEMHPHVEGGAIKVDTGASLRITNCIFENCVAVNSGGAVDAGGVRVEIEDCVFRGNRSTGYGGGAFAGGGDIVIRNCLFENNSAKVEAGAVWATNGTLEMENCRLVRNRAAFGGGMVSYGIEGTIRNSTWLENQVTQSGGALYCRQGNLVVEQSTFVSNSGIRGGAIAARASGSTRISLRRSIVAFNKGESEIYCGTGRIELDECDVWSQDGDVFVGCLTEGWEGRGNFSVDPLFCDRFGGDLRLQDGSPCADIEGRPLGAWPVGCEGDPGGLLAGAGLVSGDRAPASDRTSSAARDGERLPEGESTSSMERSAFVMSASPNPFRDGTSIELSLAEGSGSGAVRVDLFDLNGRLVRRLEGVAEGSGSFRIVWDGRDDEGREAPVGAYFARASFGQNTETLRLVRMR